MKKIDLSRVILVTDGELINKPWDTLYDRSISMPEFRNNTTPYDDDKSRSIVSVLSAVAMAIYNVDNVDEITSDQLSHAGDMLRITEYIKEYIENQEKFSRNLIMSYADRVRDPMAYVDCSLNDQIREINLMCK